MTPKLVAPKGKLGKKHIVAILIAALAVAVIFRELLKAVLAMSALFLIGAFSTFYRRKLENFGELGFEFVTFTTVIAGVAFGPIAGAIFGFVTAFAAMAIARDMEPTSFLFVAASTIIGAAAQPLSSHLGILSLGLISIAFSAMLAQFFTFFIQPELEPKIVVATGIIVNFAANYILFAYLAKPILAIITL